MYYVGVDLGATNVRAVVGDETATVLGSDSRGTPSGPNGIAVTEAVLGVVRGACEDAGIDPTAVVAAGIGLDRSPRSGCRDRTGTGESPGHRRTNSPHRTGFSC